MFTVVLSHYHSDLQVLLYLHVIIKGCANRVIYLTPLLLGRIEALHLPEVFLTVIPAYTV